MCGTVVPLFNLCFANHLNTELLYAARGNHVWWVVGNFGYFRRWNIRFIALCMFAWLVNLWIQWKVDSLQACVCTSFLKRALVWYHSGRSLWRQNHNTFLKSALVRYKSLGVIKIHSPYPEISSSASIMMKMTHFFALTQVSLIAKIRESHENSILPFEFTVQQCKASTYTLKNNG